MGTNPPVPASARRSERWKGTAVSEMDSNQRYLAVLRRTQSETPVPCLLRLEQLKTPVNAANLPTDGLYGDLFVKPSRIKID
jgi:hypothetical protein